MRQLTEKRSVTAANAWGQDVTSDRRRFAVEQADVGTDLNHYLGHNHRTRQFRNDDVGRVIEVITSPGYTCWYFWSDQPEVTP